MSRQPGRTDSGAVSLVPPETWCVIVSSGVHWHSSVSQPAVSLSSVLILIGSHSHQFTSTGAPLYSFMTFSSVTSRHPVAVSSTHNDFIGNVVSLRLQSATVRLRLLFTISSETWCPKMPFSSSRRLDSRPESTATLSGTRTQRFLRQSSEDEASRSFAARPHVLSETRCGRSVQTSQWRYTRRRASTQPYRGRERSPSARLGRGRRAH